MTPVPHWPLVLTLSFGAGAVDDVLDVVEIWDDEPRTCVEDDDTEVDEDDDTEAEPHVPNPDWQPSPQ